MSLAAGAISMGRKQAEALMVTQCVVKRANGTATEDPVTKKEIPNYDTIYSGPCKLRFPAGTPTNGVVPGAVVTDQRAELSFPVAGSGAIRVNDVWTCTENPLDPELVGRVLRIAGVHSQSFATARRFPAVEKS